MATASAGSRRVDSHAHVVSKAVPRTDSRPRHTGEAHDALPEELLEHLDANDIRYCLLTAPSPYGTNNSLLLDTIARFPDRFRGTAIVDPAISLDDLVDLRRRGVEGIRLNWLQRPDLPDPANPAFSRFLRTVADAGLHLEIFLEGERQPPLITAACDAGVTLVFDHFGCPDPDLGIGSPAFQTMLRLMTAGQAWVKLSAPYRLRAGTPKSFVDALLDAGGASHLLWGSDWPWAQHGDGLSYHACLGWLNEWIDDAATIDRILSANPLTLFGFERDAVSNTANNASNNEKFGRV